MTELVADHGYAGVTVRALVRTSEVSTSAFYRQFPNVEECFASTYRTILQCARGRLVDVSVVGRRKEDRLRAWVWAILGAAAENPHAARLVLVDCYDGGPAMVREIAAATEEIERQLADSPVALPLPLGRAVVAGVEYAIRAKVLEGREAQLPDVADELADWVVRVAALEPRYGSELRAEGKGVRQVKRGRDPGLAAFAAIGGDRGRVLAAVAKLSSDGGYWNLSLPAVRREAGVSRRHFDALFPNLDHAYLEAIATVSTAAARAVIAEMDETSLWPSRVEELCGRFCDQIARSPLLRRLAFVDVFAPGSAGLRCRDRLLSRSARLLRTTQPPDRASAKVAIDAALAATWRVFQAEIKATGGPPGVGSASFAAELILAAAGTSTESSVYGETERTNPRVGGNGARAR